MLLSCVQRCFLMTWRVTPIHQPLGELRGMPTHGVQHTVYTLHVVCLCWNSSFDLSNIFFVSCTEFSIFSKNKFGTERRAVCMVCRILCFSIPGENIWGSILGKNFRRFVTKTEGTPTLQLDLTSLGVTNSKKYLCSFVLYCCVALHTELHLMPEIFPSYLKNSRKWPKKKSNHNPSNSVHMQKSSQFQKSIKQEVCLFPFPTSENVPEDGDCQNEDNAVKTRQASVGPTMHYDRHPCTVLNNILVRIAIY